MVGPVGNIQDNLSKTELIQRIQQILQDAERAQQARQMVTGDLSSARAQEQVADTRQPEGNVVREDQGRREPFAGRRRRKGEPQSGEQDEPSGKKPSDPAGAGGHIDVTA
jgi:hypothetical protein